MTIKIHNIITFLELVNTLQIKKSSEYENVKTGFELRGIEKGSDFLSFKQVDNFCQLSSLILFQNGKYEITKLGFEFLNKTSSKDDLSKFLINTCILDGNLSEIILPILSNFDLTTWSFHCKMSEIQNSFKNHAYVLGLFYELNFLIKNYENEIIEVNPEISNTPSFEKLMKKNKLIQNKQRKSISLVDQERNRKIKEENDKITGRLAEEIVETYEKKRLEVSGFHDEANNVKQISDEKSTLGYDIESFFGKADDITVPDKLIEVKGTTTNVFRFFWSKNEIKTAQKLGQNYWIYFVSEIDKDKKTGNIIRKIQDPFEKIFPLNYFDKDTGEYGIECDSYIISDKLE
jgi:hypothetical protein